MSDLRTFTAHAQHSRLIVRPMVAEDIPAVLAIDQVSFSLPWPESAYRFELFENPGSLLWVAETVSQEGNSQIVGMIVVWLILDECHIATLAAHPAHRQRGIGQLLLATALKESTLKGCRSATLEVRASNANARALYRKFGFAIAGRRLRYYRDNNEDAIIMTVADLGEEYLNWLESAEFHQQGGAGQPGSLWSD